MAQASPFFGYLTVATAMKCMTPEAAGQHLATQHLAYEASRELIIAEILGNGVSNPPQLAETWLRSSSAELILLWRYGERAYAYR